MTTTDRDNVVQLRHHHPDHSGLVRAAEALLDAVDDAEDASARAWLRREVERYHAETAEVTS